MLREPSPVKTSEIARQIKPQARLRLVRLEERIAPTCHTNPHGKEVGNCSNTKNGGSHGGFV